MSSLAAEPTGQNAPAGSYSPPEEQARAIRNRLREAREWRRKLEPNWQLLLQFAAGRHWLAIDARDGRTIRKISDLDSRYRGRELYTADIISEYRDHVLGELGSDDDRPQLLLEQENKAGEEFQGQLNRALGYCWNHEADADEALAEADALCVDLGTSGVRVRFDPSKGPLKGELPQLGGQPIRDMGSAYEQVSQAVQSGQTLDFQQVPEGRITLEPLSTFNMLVPPGIARERYFPWEAVIRPVPLATVKADYGGAAGELSEDRDIGSTLGLGAKPTGDNQGSSTLRDHVWLTTYYERPSPKFPKGRVFHFAGADFKLLRIEEELPYKDPNGDYCSGIVYFHWRRVSGRFFSRGVVESLKESQRAKNEHRTTTREIIRRGVPYVLIPEGPQQQQLKQTRRPLEIVPYPPGQGQPTPVQGIGPGPWMATEDEMIRDDAEHASGVKAVSMGENPPAVQTLGQLTQLKQGDVIKRQTSIRDRKQAIARMVESMVYDMRQYWGDRKQILLSPEGEDRIEATVFNASKIPSFFVVAVAKGSPQPRDQAAELVKIEELWNAALQAGVIATAPDKWIKWRAESMEAGQARPLPDNPADEHTDKAELENHWLNEGSRPVVVASYDPPEVHIPLHRKAQIQAELSEDAGAWKRINAHIDDHEAAAQENAQKLQAQQIANQHDSGDMAQAAADSHGMPVGQQPQPPQPQQQ